MNAAKSLLSGLAGASVLTLTHESLKKIDPQAPRMDLLGMQALAKVLKGTNWSGSRLFYIALAGDLIANSLYYSLSGVGSSRSLWLRSTALGVAAGVGAVLLPKRLGLNEEYSSRSLHTKLVTVGLYVAGALVTTAVLKLLSKKQKKRDTQWENRLLTSAMG
jgi:hypothetical protein